HSASHQEYSDSVTTEAFAGCTSAARASGSAFASAVPSGVMISNLYRVPLPTCGTNSSQTPLSPSERIDVARPSQPLKSPMTRTARAFGAQTANEVPTTSPNPVG